MLELGKREQKIIQECFLRRIPLPERIKNAPELFMGLELFFSAFMDLNTCRSSGWNLMPITWDSVILYACTYDFTEEQTEDLIHFIFKMDEAFLKHCESKSKSKK